MSPLYQESSRPGVGRVLEAGRDVSPGQPVLQEETEMATLAISTLHLRHSILGSNSRLFVLEKR